MGRTVDGRLRISKREARKIAQWFINWAREEEAKMRATLQAPFETPRITPEIVKALREAFREDEPHPKVHALLERLKLGRPSRETIETLNALAEHMHVPGRRGRWPDPETAERIRRLQALTPRHSQYQIAKELGMDYHGLRSLKQRIKSRG